MNRDEALDELVKELTEWPKDLQNCISRATGWEWTNSGRWIVLCGSGPMVEAIISENDWIEARAKADARMNNIVRNGNDGDHYEGQGVENSGDAISDGSTAKYYELPKDATELQHLISHRDMNAQMGEIFRAVYRYGIASHSDKLRDAKKVKFYIDAEIERLEKLTHNS